MCGLHPSLYVRHEPSFHAEFASMPPPHANNAPALADHVPVADLMERSVVSVAPELPIAALMALFVEYEISGAPVVDAEGRPIGMVTKSDVVRACNDDCGATSRARVHDIMMPLSFSLTESATVARAAALMAFEGVHRIVIIGMTGSVVGILSSLDVLRWVAKQSGYVVPG